MLNFIFLAMLAQLKKAKKKKERTAVLNLDISLLKQGQREYIVNEKKLGGGNLQGIEGSLIHKG